MKTMLKFSGRTALALAGVVSGLTLTTMAGSSLYFTAGPNDESNGLLGALRAEGGGRRVDD